MKEYLVISYEDVHNEIDDMGDRLLNGRYYSLAGFDNSYSYHASNFAILPEQSADEMSEETGEAIVNIETQPI